MAKPVEINLPDQASETAQATIPASKVPRVAAALRQLRPDITGDLSDEEVVAEGIMLILRDETRAFEHSEAVRIALEQTVDTDPGF